MNALVRLLIGFGFSLTFAVSMSARTWTNNDGQTVEAELVEIVDNATIKIRLDSTQKLFDYPIANLSQADRDHIKSIRAQEKQKAREALLEKRRARWTDDYEDAVEEAKELDLPILLLFTGSDWCGYCIQLKENVFEEREFREYANRNLVLMMADFPRKGLSRRVEEQNQALKTKHSVSGYPTVFLLDPNEKKLGQIGGYGGQPVEDYLARIEGFTSKR